MEKKLLFVLSIVIQSYSMELKEDGSGYISVIEIQSLKKHDIFSEEQKNQQLNIFNETNFIDLFKNSLELERNEKLEEIAKNIEISEIENQKINDFLEEIANATFITADEKKLKKYIDCKINQLEKKIIHSKYFLNINLNNQIIALIINIKNLAIQLNKALKNCEVKAEEFKKIFMLFEVFKQQVSESIKNITKTEQVNKNEIMKLEPLIISYANKIFRNSENNKFKNYLDLKLNQLEYNINFQKIDEATKKYFYERIIYLTMLTQRLFKSFDIKLENLEKNYRINKI